MPLVVSERKLRAYICLLLPNSKKKTSIAGTSKWSPQKIVCTQRIKLLGKDVFNKELNKD